MHPRHLWIFTDKEKEIIRLTAITEKEKERLEQMNSQVMKLQAENRKTKKKNHYQELIKAMEKEKGHKTNISNR